MRILIFLMLAVAVIGCTSSNESALEGKTISPAATTATVTTDSLTSSEKPPMIGQRQVPVSTVESTPTATISAIETTPTPGITPAPQKTDVASVASEPQITSTSTAQAPQSREYLQVAKLSLEHYVESVAWGEDGRNLIYALQGELSLRNVPYFEPRNWDWWQFDPVTGENTPLTPPDSMIDLETRQALGVCADWPPEETSIDGCAGSPLLHESPYSDRIVYNPIARGETTWMAHKDGSNVMKLEGIRGIPLNADWSSDGRWGLVSVYAYRAPGMEVHYLVDTDNGSVRELGELTGHTLTFVNYLRPQFSPDSRYLVYAATEDRDYEVQSGYGLYLLDMSTLESERLTDRFGPFQWEVDSQGLYVLDNAIVFEFAEDMSAMRKAALYHIDLSSRPFQEALLFDNIDFYPNDSMSAWHWAYSPEAQAIGYIGLRPENELGILFLSP